MKLKSISTTLQNVLSEKCLSWSFVDVSWNSFILICSDWRSYLLDSAPPVVLCNCTCTWSACVLVRLGTSCTCTCTCTLYLLDSPPPVAKTVGIIFGGALSLWIGLSVGCVLFAFLYLHCIWFSSFALYLFFFCTCFCLHLHCICLCIHFVFAFPLQCFLFYIWTLLSHLQVRECFCLFIRLFAGCLFCATTNTIKYNMLFARWLFVLRDDHFSQVCSWSDLRGLSFLSKQWVVFGLSCCEFAPPRNLFA